MPEEVFDGLDNLTSLDLGDNQIGALPEEVFDGLDSLKSLVLLQNQLSTLPEELFDGLSALVELNLARNQITSLPTGVFEGLRLTSMLGLSRNPGAPFTLTAELEEEEGRRVVVKVAQGAPFPAQVTLTARGGQLSADTVTIAAGRVASDTIEVTPNEGRNKVTVRVTGARFTGSASISGLNTQLQAGESITLKLRAGCRWTGRCAAPAGATASRGAKALPLPASRSDGCD